MNKYQAHEWRRKIEHAASTQSDEDALLSIDLFAKWSDQIGKAVYVNERYQYKEKLWKVVQAHTVQADWAPDIAVSLFIEVSLDEWPEWKQPVGATDAYNVGDKVSHNNKHWVSIIDGNVWEPGAVGTESLWEEKQWRSSSPEL